MQAMKSEHLNVYQMQNNERRVDFPLPGRVELRSSLVRRPGYATRSWYLQGDFGVIQFPSLEDGVCLQACDEFLEQNGYHKEGDLPPKCFVYTR